ncbi:putative cytosolic acyl coenzyme A thioester hydrolase-like [Ptychodera flava]|uniref:putative cytosolic acyl coenzyme A thioester hydrolase-like n=1 Tax=Ptychodera flava TaxID=63121 RepID=UPI003969EC5A
MYLAHVMASLCSCRRISSSAGSIQRCFSVNIRRKYTTPGVLGGKPTVPFLRTAAAIPNITVLFFRGDRLTRFRQFSIISGLNDVIHTPDSRVQVSRVMSPDDANPLGFIHGGIVLQMIGEAGYISATKYCNSQESRSQGNKACFAALARAERTDFLQSMFVGEFAKVNAEVTYTSKHSLEVQVTVFAENVMKGTQRLTNRAHLWYVPVSVDDGKVVEVPAMTYSSPEMEEQGRLRYETQKSQRRDDIGQTRNAVENEYFHNFGIETAEPYTVPYSQSSLTHFILSADCTLQGYVRGGTTMKLMDEVAGLVAIKHCMSPAVTASVDAINFHKKIKQAGLINLFARLTYTSDKSIEVQVLVDVQYISLTRRQIYKERACDAYFTFVSLSQKDFSPQKIPPLKLLTEVEVERFKSGHERYKAKKALRNEEKQRKA